MLAGQLSRDRRRATRAGVLLAREGVRVPSLIGNAATRRLFFGSPLAEAHIDANKMQGCASQVWLTTAVRPNGSRVQVIVRAICRISFVHRP